MSLYGNQFIETSCGLIKISDLFELYRDNLNLPLIKTFNEHTNIFYFSELSSMKCHISEGKSFSLKDCQKSLCFGADQEILCARGWKRAAQVIRTDIIVVDRGVITDPISNHIGWCLKECTAATFLERHLSIIEIRLLNGWNYILSSKYHTDGIMVKSF